MNEYAPDSTPPSLPDSVGGAEGTDQLAHRMGLACLSSSSVSSCPRRPASLRRSIDRGRVEQMVRPGEGKTNGPASAALPLVQTDSRRRVFREPSR